MSKFSKKAQKGTGGSNVDWDAYNNHLLEQIGDELENRIAVVSGLIDLGKQERPDYVEEYTGSKSQEKAISEGRSHVDEDEDGEEVLVTPRKPAEQVAIMADFPEVMINYGKFFSEDGEDDWRPYRHLITGEFWSKTEHKMFAKGVSLTCTSNDKAPSKWAYDPKSTIHKLATSCIDPETKKTLAKGVVDQGFDIGELLDAVFSMDLVAEESKNGKHVNIKAKNIGKKHTSIPVPDHNIEGFGVMFDGGNEDEDLKQLRSSVINTLELAEGWDTSGLKEELEAYRNRQSQAKPSKEEDKEEEKEDGVKELDYDSMDDDEIKDLAEELGMRITTRTRAAKALKFIQDHYEEHGHYDPVQEEEEEADEDEPKKAPEKTSTKSSTKAKGKTEDSSEDDTDESEDPPF